MHDSFEIASSAGAYSVTIGSDLLSKALTDTPNAIVVIDKALEERLPAHVTRRVAIEAIEANKSLEYAPNIIKALRRHDADRTSHVLAIGGGIIQDITTFATSIFMRGISWTYMPTTLLGMVDSCIGGKSSINVAGLKNFVGNFHPPKQVLVDVAFVKTLDAEMIISGLCEAAKIAYASGKDDFDRYLADQPRYPLPQEAAFRIISHSLRIKKRFIEIDELDQNERLLLNYGHTFGHALEAGTDFGISHGIGVGIGMLVATSLARQSATLTAEGNMRVAQLEHIVAKMLASGVGRSLEHLSNIDLGVVMEKFEYDKKHVREAYRLILPQVDGSLQLISVARNDAARVAIVAAYETVLAAMQVGCRAPQATALA